MDPRLETREEGADVRDTRAAGDGANWEIHDQHKILALSNFQKVFNLKGVKEMCNTHQSKFISIPVLKCWIMLAKSGDASMTRAKISNLQCW